MANPRPLIAINLLVVLALTSYLLSVQLIEPAVTYTVSSGAMPVTAYLLYRFGIPEGEPMRNRMEALGNILLFCGLLYLAVITIIGLTGFVRGDRQVAFAGILLAITDGVFFTLVLVFSKRLGNVGVGPGAVLGLRLPLYVLLAAVCVSLGVDHKESLPPSQIALFAFIGFLLTVPPLYTLQKAVSMISTLTVSTLTALGPFVIFALQMIEGRVDYAPATLLGLCIYFAGSLLAAIGAVRAATTSTEAPR